MPGLEEVVRVHVQRKTEQLQAVASSRPNYAPLIRLAECASLPRGGAALIHTYADGRSFVEVAAHQSRVQVPALRTAIGALDAGGD